MRRLRGEQSRITVRLPTTERREAERVARDAGIGLSNFVRQAIREKIRREHPGGSPSEDPAGRGRGGRA